MKIIACIPARYGSTRLCGKPLFEINSKPIIQHVYERVSKVKIIDEVIVLTDDERIKTVIEDIGGNCKIINKDCLNGTDRICYYLEQSNLIDPENLIIVNVQGDEPFIDPANIELAINNYIRRFNSDSKLVCSTLHYKTNDINCIKNHSRGKLVLDLEGNIMYCSRNPIPSAKNTEIVFSDKNIPILYNIHVGVFVFKAEYLLNHYEYNTPLQLCEDIEWMKIMEQGFHINSIEIESHEIGVDTIDDYNYLKNKYTL
jgi:3-deoxy-manno-octulosonate cytidylyltransferase (CMP-KDO synthetase)